MQLKRALAGIGVAIFATMAALTVAFSSGHTANADNTFGGAGDTVTQAPPPSTLDTPSFAPPVKATAYGSG
jgi:hypothetical protein